jgi:ATP-binding cassette subfamily B protein
MPAFRKLSTYLKPYWIYVILGPLLMVIEVSMDLLQPRLLETIIDVGIANLDLNVILKTSLWMALAALIGAGGGMGCTVAAVKASMAFSADLRSALFRKIQTLSYGNLDKLETGQLVTRLTNDVNQLGQMVMNLLRGIVRTPLILIGSIIMATITSPRLALIFVVLIPILTWILVATMNRAYPMFTNLQQKLDRLNSNVQEYLSGVRVVKAFVRGPYEERRFNTSNDAYRDQGIQAIQFMATMMPLMMLVMNLGLVAVLWLGGKQVNLGSFQAGQLVAFVNYLLRGLNTLTMIAMLLVQFSRAQASADRVVEVLESEPQVKDPGEALSLALYPAGRVAFEKVSFSFNGSQDRVLNDISFVAEPGKTVAILGATGSGKSSLIHLIPRFYDVTAGRITLDGVDIRDVPQAELRRHIGVALQEVVLFSGTIRDNLRYSRPAASDEDVIAAAKAAQAHDFILSFPDGYDTVLGQRGVNLSGGQKQRIAIARALLMKPTVLILDDSTSAVDATTESKIQAAMAEIMKGRTSFVIAQRISTVLTADQILVLDEGRLVDQGTHAELLARCPIYQDIYASQLGGGPVTQATLQAA